MDNVVGYALKIKIIYCRLQILGICHKTKKLRIFAGIELFVSRSRLELPSAAADIKPMLNEVGF